MNKRYIQKGIVAGPVSSTIIIFSLFIIILVALFSGFKYRVPIITYLSITLLMIFMITVKKLYNRSYLSLTLSDDGLEYKSCFWEYFRFVEKTKKYSWAEIDDISWMNVRGGAFKIQARGESFTFFNEYANNNIDAFEAIKKHLTELKSRGV